MKGHHKMAEYAKTPTGFGCALKNRRRRIDHEIREATVAKAVNRASRVGAFSKIAPPEAVLPPREPVSAQFDDDDPRDDPRFIRRKRT